MPLNLPLPKVVADTEAGGGIPTAINALHNLEIKRAEAKYAPLTTQANAISKLAYSNLMGPQFLAKMLGNPDIAANLTPEQIKNIIKSAYGAGSGQQVANSLLMNNQQNQSSMLDQFGPFGQFIKGIRNAFKFGQNPNAQQNNALTNNNPSQNVDLSNMQPGQSYTNNSSSPQAVTFKGQGNNPSSSYEYDANGNNVVASPQVVSDIANRPRNENEDTYFEKSGRAAGIKKEGEQLGIARGKAIEDLGQQQLDLSNSGIILDRLIGITQNPEFQKMRDQIPYFQDKQLWHLSKKGTKEQQNMIGDLISTAQAFKASTVNSFRGKALEKEFNLADKIKIDENDTIGVIQGKIRSLKTLKEIAESKNDIIIDLMTEKHMNLGDATKKANKMINTSAIEKEVDMVLNPQPTEHDIQYMMKKRNLTRAEIVNQLKAKGYKNVS